MSKFNFIYAEDLSHREKTVYIYLRDRADASGVSGACFTLWLPSPPRHAAPATERTPS